ncbi:Luc7-like protein 3 [Nowakowskiella sp. JEL0407]|nr:Luc7-like protein 3 [Nowakowskiella sp. JEL0407]
MDFQRQLLAELMAPLMPGAKSFRDKDICKHHLVSFCPHELFTNTKSDLGPCSNIHDDKLVEQYRNSPDYGKLGYEQQFYSFLQNLVLQLDRTIRKGKERLGIKPAESEEKQERIIMLEEKVKKVLADMEAAGEDGNMDEAQRLGLEAESMKAELEAIKNSDDKNPILRHEKRMEVCEVCAAFLVMGDSTDRVEAHLSGKQHTGYLRIREAVEEFKKKEEHQSDGHKEEYSSHRDQPYPSSQGTDEMTEVDMEVEIITVGEIGDIEITDDEAEAPAENLLCAQLSLFLGTIVVKKKKALAMSESRRDQWSMNNVFRLIRLGSQQVHPRHIFSSLKLCDSVFRGSLADNLKKKTFSTRPNPKFNSSNKLSTKETDFAVVCSLKRNYSTHSIYSHTSSTKSSPRLAAAICSRQNSPSAFAAETSHGENMSFNDIRSRTNMHLVFVPYNTQIPLEQNSSSNASVFPDEHFSLSLINVEDRVVSFFIPFHNTCSITISTKLPLRRSNRASTSSDILFHQLQKRQNAVLRRENILTSRQEALRKSHVKHQERITSHANKQIARRQKLKDAIETAMERSQLNRDRIIRSKQLEIRKALEKVCRVATMRNEIDREIFPLNRKSVVLGSIKLPLLPICGELEIDRVEDPVCDDGRLVARFDTNRRVFARQYVQVDIDEPPNLLSVDFERLSEEEYEDYLHYLPPITRYSLRELNIEEFIKLVQIRHDFCFDANLQFKKNFDDQSKCRKLDEYWVEIVNDFSQNKYERVPILIFEIRQIILDMLPSIAEETFFDPNSQESRFRGAKFDAEWVRNDLQSRLDISLISQQLRRGVLDSFSIAYYIADFLKSHCSSCRIHMADRIVMECQRLNFAGALRGCFEMLEQMKLDFANIQIQRLRPLILKNSVEFEWKYFQSQLQSGETSLRNTFRWLKSTYIKQKRTDDWIAKPTFVNLYHESLFLLFQQAINFNNEEAIQNLIPETLSMDVSRIISLYNSWTDLTILACLLLIFRHSCTGFTSKRVVDAKSLDKCMVEAKVAFSSLLTDFDVSANHVTFQISSLVETFRGEVMEEKELDFLRGFVDRILGPFSAVSDLIGKKIITVMQNWLDRQNNLGMNGAICENQRGVTSVPVDEALLKRFGLFELKEEIGALCENFLRLSEHNRAVYAPAYRSLYLQIIQKL